MEPRTHTVIDSPTGPLTLVAEGGELVGLHFALDGRSDEPSVLGEPDPSAFDDVRAQLDEYFAGERTEFDVPLDPVGTEFQLRAWEALRRIPYGETRSYGEQARTIGSPAAVRAVGAANGRNPISIIVPCHRVVGSDGSLTGFGGGLDAKRYLLDLETRAGTLFG